MTTDFGDKLFELPVDERDDKFNDNLLSNVFQVDISTSPLSSGTVDQKDNKKGTRWDRAKIIIRRCILVGLALFIVSLSYVDTIIEKQIGPKVMDKIWGEVFYFHDSHNTRNGSLRLPLLNNLR